MKTKAAADGWTYLEAAPEDLAGTYAWDTTKPATKSVPTSDEIGSGKVNTAAIIAALGDTGEAATAAVAYSCGGKNDWFLPNYFEIYAMYTNLHEKGLGEFKAGCEDYYWSSSQYFTYFAWYQRFRDGSQDDYVNYNKTAALSVRVVRAF